jgi:hypothetical protein
MRGLDRAYAYMSVSVLLSVGASRLDAETQLLVYVLTGGIVGRVRPGRSCE